MYDIIHEEEYIYREGVVFIIKVFKVGAGYEVKAFTEDGKEVKISANLNGLNAWDIEAGVGRTTLNEIIKKLIIAVKQSLEWEAENTGKITMLGDGNLPIGN